jgi:hypothetical protein
MTFYIYAYIPGRSLSFAGALFLHPPVKPRMLPEIKPLIVHIWLIIHMRSSSNRRTVDQMLKADESIICPSSTAAFVYTPCDACQLTRSKPSKSF